MRAKITKWTQVLDFKAKSVHSNLLALQEWMERSGADGKLTEEASAPYYHLLASIYEEDFPLAKALDSSDLLLLLEGSAVSCKNPRLSLISTVFSSVRRRVGTVAYALSGVVNQSTLPKDVDLGLAGFSHGSLYLGFSLADASAPDDKGNRSLLAESDPLYQATKEAIKTIGIVSQKIASGASEEQIKKILPDPKIRDTTLIAIEQLAPSGKLGIDSVSLAGKGMRKGFRKLTPELRAKVKEWVQHPVKSEKKERFSGIVREIDLDVRRFELRRISGSSIEDIRCIYPAQFESVAKNSLDQKVSVVGRVEKSSDGKPKLLEIEKIELEATPDPQPGLPSL
jgi:hypothetical protein